MDWSIDQFQEPLRLTGDRRADRLTAMRSRIHRPAASWFEAARKAPPERPPRDVGLTEPGAADRFACTHRGPKIGEHRCKPCDGGRLHTVYRCELFGRACTIRASTAKDESGRRALVCLACDDRRDCVVTSTHS